MINLFNFLFVPNAILLANKVEKFLRNEEEKGSFEDRFHVLREAFVTGHVLEIA